MSSRKKLGSAAIIFAVISVLFMGARSKQKSEEQSTASLHAKPQYSVPGPFATGMRDLSIGSETALDITVWYPAANGEVGGKSIEYPYEVKMDDPIGTLAVASYSGKAVQAAPYGLDAGPYPLVILSPGFSIGSSAYAWLGEHLASYGFVVIAPEHHERLDPANELWRAAVLRPRDILAVFDYVDEQAALQGKFARLVDGDLAAVIGHSYGGYTALAAAGAQLDTESFQAHCTNVRQANDPSAWLCDEILPHWGDMAALAGLEGPPSNLWPAWADPRVDAIVPLAGDAFFFGQAGLAGITVPVMAVGGTADQDAPYRWGTQPAYEYVSSAKKVRIALMDAGHMIFTGPCEASPWYLKFFSGEFCSDPGWDRGYAHALVRHFTTAFLLAELKQDADAATALAPQAIDFPGVTYDAQGY